MDDVVRIKKYPNRRLYDQTHSRHLTQSQLHEMVASGRRVQITDSASGDDITNAVLLQLLVDRDALRLGAIPAVFLHLLVQGQESLVRSSMDQSMRWFGDQARAATQPTDAWAQAAASFLGPAGWTGPLGWMNGAGSTDSTDSIDSIDSTGSSGTPGRSEPGPEIADPAASSAADASAAPEQEVAALRDAMGTLLDQLRAMESRLEELEHRSAGDER